jgi:hypothetical protein
LIISHHFLHLFHHSLDILDVGFKFVHKSFDAFEPGVDTSMTVDGVWAPLSCLTLFWRVWIIECTFVSISLVSRTSYQ